MNESPDKSNNKEVSPTSGINSPVSGGSESSVDGLRSALGNIENKLNPARNPSENLVSKGVAAGASGSKAVNDAVETAKDVKDIATALEGDPNAIANLIKRDLLHPIESGKRYARLSMYAVGFFLFQMALVVSFIVLIVFAVYKVSVMFKGVTDLVTKPTQIATTLRVNYQTALYLARTVPKLALEEQEKIGRNKGVVVAAPLTEDVVNNNNLSEVKLNPAMQKMFDTWKKANLEKEFFETYHARLIPNGTASQQITNFDPAAWDLYVQDNKIGNLNSDQAQAFLGTFTKQTMHWDDIYTRVGLRRVAQEKFDSKDGKLQLEDVGLDMKKSRINVTKKIVGDTMKPISEKSNDYFRCILEGGKACDSLGLGTVNAPVSTNSSTGSFVTQAIFAARNAIYSRLLASFVNNSALSNYASSQSAEITDEVDGPSKRTSLVGKIETGASDVVLDSVPKELDSLGNPTVYPDRVALLEMYDRFKNATDNGNIGRTMYDRYTDQSVKQSMNYFTGSGQILNWDIDITNAWSLTDNLSVVEESPIYRRAFMNGSMSVFADGNEKYTKSCQTTFNDPKPVNDGTDYKKRPKNQNVCFSKTLMPITNEFKNEQGLVEIYKQIEQRNSSFNSGSAFGFIGQTIQRVSDLIAQRVSGQIRTSPLATDKLSIDTNLSPDFDGYNNQIYGTSLTGGETNGEAFDAMWGAVEAINSAAMNDKTYGLGSQYLTNKQVAIALNKSNNLDKIAMQYRPLKDRMLSLNTANSLAGRLAMLVPTNTEDGSSKLASLLTPSNIFSTYAIRFMPSTLAATASSASMVNPMNAARIGYALDDPSNQMDGQELWNKYQCENGGPEQQYQTISVDIPFTLPTTTNPCQRENVLSTITTCWFSTEDDCSLDGQGSAAYSSSNPSNPTESENPTGPVSPEDIVRTTGCGGIEVHRNILAQVEQLCQAAYVDGMQLTGSGYRSTQEQIRLRTAHGCGGSRIYDRSCRGNPPTAVPGRSNHERGLAIDFRNCSSRGSACYRWLARNAERFGMYNLPSEPWHWSVDGH